MLSDIWAQAAPRLPDALWITVSLTVISAALGLVLATTLALAARASLAARAFAEAFSFVFRGTPLLVQLFLIYYGSGQFVAELRAIGLWPWFRDAYFCAILALSLNTAAYSYELIKGALSTLPKGHIEAAKAIGLPPRRTLVRIEAPYLIRTALPAYINEFIFLFQATSLVSLITIIDLTGLATAIANRSFRFIEVYLGAAVFYLLLVFVIVRGFRILEQHMNRHMGALPVHDAIGGGLAGFR